MFTIDDLIQATGGKLLWRGKTDRITGISTDSRCIRRGEAFIALRGATFDGHAFLVEVIRKGASSVLIDRQAAKRSMALWRKKFPHAAFFEVGDTTRALGEIAGLYRRRFEIPVIAVTGSNGKTTTKEMIAQVLGCRYNVLKNDGTKNNNIGLPQTLLRLTSRHDVVVTEIGTNHFGEVENLTRIALPTVGVITNIGSAHLEAFGNLQGVFKEKSALLKGLRAPGIVVLNADCAYACRQAALVKKGSLVLSVGMKNLSDFSASEAKCKGTGFEFLVNSKQRMWINSSAGHNVYNALMALAVGRVFGIGYKESARVFSGFCFPKGRFHQVVSRSVRFIDDTYNANPNSLGEALEALKKMSVKGRKICVIGDMFELGRDKERFHHEAGLQASKSCDVIVAVGKLSKFIAKAAGQCGFDTDKIFTCDSAVKARSILRDKVSVKSGDIVLVKGSRGMKMEDVIAL